MDCPGPRYSRLYRGNVALGVAEGGAIGDVWDTPTLKDRGLAGGKLENDHRPGVVFEASRTPNSNLFGHPSSVCLENFMLVQ